MSVNINDDTASVMNDTKAGVSIFLRTMTDRIATYSDPNTPKKEGRLRQGIIKQVLGLHGSIEWRKAYASVQEAGQRLDGSHKITHYSTPGTGAHFAENAVKKAVAETNVVLTATRVL